MKLHRPLLEAIHEGLVNSFIEHKQADKVIELLLKSNKKWGARDRAFIAENFYEMVRYWRKICFVAQIEQPQTQDIWQLIGTWFVMNAVVLPDWNEWTTISTEEIENRMRLANEIRKIRESVPDWLDEWGEKQFGENWDNELKALNRPASVYLRVNTLKISRNSLVEKLKKQGIEVEKITDISDGLVLKQRKNLRTNELYKSGFFEIQDAGSQLIAPFLEAKENSFVIDACAGAGGKTLHLATTMHNKGKLVAMDVEGFKLKELSERAKRNGISIISTKTISEEVVKKYENSCDYLLLDVPCSGLGVLRRNPDAKWKMTPDFIEKIQKTQADILQNYTKMLKKGGKVVYATCSILSEENERQVECFLSQNAGFKLVIGKSITPASYGFDGFYMALMEKMI